MAENMRYETAKELYKGLGVDAEQALEALGRIPISMHCWQGDDEMCIRDRICTKQNVRNVYKTPRRSSAAFLLCGTL